MFEFLNTYIPNPIAFTVFGFDIRWYGVMIGFGMILGSLLALKRCDSHEINQDHLLDAILVCIPMALIGARAYYVIFEWENQYAGKGFLNIINVRNGGLAIHGGLIMTVICLFLLCKMWNIGVFDTLDLIAPSIAIGQAVGRWGNYFNSEAHGGPCDLPWAIPVNGQMVHPTFLYESIWCLLLCVILTLLDRNRKFDGQIALLYGMLYSIERFFVEDLRTDSLMIGSFKQAQLISLVAFVFCLVIYIYLSATHKNDNKRRVVDIHDYRGIGKR